jgi:HK97 family phage major capsid protein
MTIDELRALLAQNRANRNTIETEIVNLDARAADAPAEQRAGLDERRERQNRALQNLDEQRVELQGELEERQGREDEIRRHAADPANRESGDGSGGNLRGDEPEPANNRGSRLDGALRAIERHADLMTSPDVIEAALRRDRSGVGAAYLEAVASDHYRSAFGKILAHGEAMAALRMTPEERAAFERVGTAMEARAMTEGTGSAGGFGVPFALDPTILLSSTGVRNPIRAMASTITVATSEWKGVSSTGVTAGFAAEAAEASDNSPTLVQPVIHVERAQAFVPVSREVIEDYAGAGLATELAKLMVDAKDVLESEKFLEGAGHGSKEPEGLLTGLAAGQEVATAIAKTFAIGDVYALYEALPPRFQVDASFTCATAIADTIYRLVGGGNTTEPKIMDTRDAGILGRPTSEWSNMSTAKTTTGSKILLAGDFDEFRIADRIGMSVELIPHLFGASQRPTGQRGIYAYWRTGSTVLVPNAFRVLKVA